LSDFPCFTCGRCCHGPAGWVQVFDEDLAVMGPELAAFLVVPGIEEPAKNFLRMENGHCAKLDCSNGEFRCSIYERRPLMCRVYDLWGTDKNSLCPPKPPDVLVPINPYRVRPETK
jgi:Fe-S-cluster containining protein